MIKNWVLMIGIKMIGYWLCEIYMVEGVFEVYFGGFVGILMV